MIGGGLAALGIVAALVLTAFQENLVFFFTPSQVAAKEAPQGRTFRIGGMVEKGSVVREPGSLEVRFTVTDFAHDLHISYTGVLPDLFREGQGIIARGRFGDGGLFVADEVQAGHGRSGEHLWMFASYGVAPDLVTLGKPMGNGYPVAAVVARSEIVDRFATQMRVFSTFGGNPVAARAALAVLDVIDDERLVENAHRVGAHLLA